MGHGSEDWTEYGRLRRLGDDLRGVHAVGRADGDYPAADGGTVRVPPHPQATLVRALIIAVKPVWASAKKVVLVR